MQNAGLAFQHLMSSSLLSGKYEIEEEIASGGMGVVYKALHTALNRPVAIKVLHPQYGGDASFLRRFRREAHALARLNHDHIIRIYDISDDQRPHYIVMELFHGSDLNQLLLERQRFPAEKALSICHQVADALAYAHAEGIIHRDIKPSNILVDPGGEVKITDFGIMAMTDDLSATPTGQILGTPEYMSPEHAKGERIDGRSDLYSLGMVLYKMLTGTTPFEGSPHLSIIGKLVYEKEEFTLSFPPTIPFPLQDLVRSLLRKQAKERIISAGKLMSEIERMMKEGTTCPEMAAARSATVPEHASSQTESMKVTSEMTSVEENPERNHGQFSTDFGSERDAAAFSTSHRPSSSKITSPVSQSGHLKIQMKFRTAFLVAGALSLLIFIGGGIDYVSLPSKPIFNSGKIPAAQDFTGEKPFPLLLKQETEPNAFTLKTFPEIQTGNKLHNLSTDQDLVLAKSEVQQSPDMNPRKNLAKGKERSMSVENRQAAVTQMEDKQANGTVQEGQGPLSVSRHAPTESNPTAPAGHEQEERSTDSEPVAAEIVLIKTDLNSDAQGSAAPVLSQEQDQGKKAFPTERDPQTSKLILSPLISTPPSEADLESVSDIIVRLKTAFDAKDIVALEQISDISPVKLQVLERMFRDYPMAKISVPKFYLTGGLATVIVTMSDLIDQDGHAAAPREGWRQDKVLIKKEGERWGKVIW